MISTLNQVSQAVKNIFYSFLFIYLCIKNDLKKICFLNTVCGVSSETGKGNRILKWGTKSRY